MTSNESSDQTAYEWQRRSIFFPRVAKLMTRYGVHTRLIMPGSYEVRRSRTLRQWIYRRSHAIDRAGPDQG